jgi:hypothetical protein
MSRHGRSKISRRIQVVRDVLDWGRGWMRVKIDGRPTMVVKVAGS